MVSHLMELIVLSFSRVAAARRIPLLLLRPGAGFGTAACGRPERSEGSQRGRSSFALLRTARAASRTPDTAPSPYPPPQKSGGGADTRGNDTHNCIATALWLSYALIVICYLNLRIPRTRHSIRFLQCLRTKSRQLCQLYGNLQVHSWAWSYDNRRTPR